MTISPASRQTRTTLFENCIRIERMIWLDGLNEVFGDDDLFDDLQSYVAHPSLNWLSKAPEWAWEDSENLVEFLTSRGPSGFIALVELQAPQYHNDAWYSASWGTTRHMWMFAEKPEDFVPLALAFREEVHAEAKRAAGLEVQS